MFGIGFDKACCKIGRLSYAPKMGVSMTEAEKLELNIRQMREALKKIRDEAPAKENGGSWAAGMAALCLASLRT